MMENDIEILKTAKETARKNVEKEPSKVHLEAFDKASKMLAECLAGDKEPGFENRLEALKYLQRVGYKVGKSKLYQDVKAGLLRLQSDGSVLESDVKAYVARAGLVKPDQMAYEIESVNLTRKKQKREVEKLTAQVEEMTIKVDILKSNLLDRNQVETEQRIKAGALMAGVNHVFRNFSRDAIQLVEGNLKYTQALVNFWTAKMESLFDEFARMDEIEVRINN